MNNRTFAFLALAATGLTAQSALLWDNNVTPNGVGARALSPPAFPNIRVVDDIVVRAPGWAVDTIRMFVIEDTAWQSGSAIDVYLYADNDGVPGSLHGYLRGLEFTKVAGASYFGRRGFTYTILLGGLHVPPGRYWLGARNLEGSGSGTNYWMSSDAGRDGRGTSAGYFSLDGGATWAPEYAARPKAFQVYGEVLPEPATFLVLGGLSLGALARRRSRGRSAGTR